MLDPSWRYELDYEPAADHLFIWIDGREPLPEDHVTDEGLVVAADREGRWARIETWSVAGKGTFERSHAIPEQWKASIRWMVSLGDQLATRGVQIVRLVFNAKS